MSLEDLEQDWPRLQNGAGYRDGEVSDANEAYNCFAWAIGRNDIRFDSSDEPCSYWPRGIEPSPYVESYVEVYSSEGFEVCDNPSLEEGCVKIALYEDRYSGEAVHAARQLSNGCWTSKMGFIEDISHQHLSSLEGYYQGYCWQAAKFMRNLLAMNKKESLSSPKNLKLAPLTPEQALFAAMNTKPPARKKAAKKTKK